MEDKKRNFLFIGFVLLLLVIIIILLYFTFSSNKDIHIKIHLESGEIKEVVLKNGEYLSLPDDQVRDGYIFSGWVNQDGVYVINTSLVVDGDEIYPEFIGIDEDYTLVTFLASEELGNIKVLKGSEFLLPKEPQKNNYIFNGWSNENGYYISNSPSLENDRTFTALWVPKNGNLVTVQIDSSGAEIYNPMYYEKGSTIIIPESPNKGGFLYWMIDNQEINNGITINNSLTIKAAWSYSSECPEDCQDIGNGQCKRMDFIPYEDVSSCEEGYEMKDGGCYNFNDRYYADFSGDVPRCNGSDYKYEEIYMGSVDIWCLPKGKTIVTHTCPEGYQDTQNNCLKEEIITCG